MSSLSQTIPCELEHVFQPRAGPLKVKLRADSKQESQPINGVGSAEQDLVKMLGPGNALDSSLLSFATTYVGIRQAFDQLLSAPYLEQIVPEGVEDVAEHGLRDLIVDIQAKFQVYGSNEVSAARNLVSMGDVLPVLLANTPIAE